MKSAFSIGRLAGVELFLHSTFPLILLWTFWQGSREGGAAMGLTRSLLVLILFACVALHELGHSLVARVFGIGTRRIVLYPIGGVAALDRIPAKPHQELLMALGGPAVNLAIAAALAAGMGGWPSWEELGSAPVTPRLWAVSLMASNLGLAIFNLIPAFPMDGGRVFRSLLSFVLSAHRATQIAYGLGLVLAAGLAFLGLYAGNPFLLVIAVFIGAAGRQENRAVALRTRLDRQDIGALRQPVRTIPVGATFADCQRQSEPGRTAHFLVVSGDRPVGLLPDLHWRSGLKDAGPDAPVTGGMIARFVAVPPALPLSELAILARQSPQVFYPVIEGGAAVGIVTSADLARAILQVAPPRQRPAGRWRLDLG